MTTFRNFTNRQGVTYNADKTEVLFAEDLNQITGAINTLEQNTPENYDDEIAEIQGDIVEIGTEMGTLASAINTNATNITALQNDKQDKELISTETNISTLTPDGTKTQHVSITALAQNLTIANPSGSLAEGKVLTIRIKPDATPRTLTFGNKYIGIGVTLPTTTVANKKMLLGCIFDATLDKVEVVSVINEA